MDIPSQLKEILSQRRYEHSMHTADLAVEYARLLGVSAEKAYLAGVLHDCAKSLSDPELIKEALSNDIAVDEIQRQSPQLLHGYVGAVYAEKKYGVTDEEVLDAIRYHTTGRPNMTKLEKAIFLADLSEIGRDSYFEDAAQIRETAFADFDKALIMAFDGVIHAVLRRGSLLHTSTVDARNALILEVEGNALRGGPC